MNLGKNKYSYTIQRLQSLCIFHFSLVLADDESSNYNFGYIKCCVGVVANVLQTYLKGGGGPIICNMRYYPDIHKTRSINLWKMRNRYCLNVLKGHGPGA